MKKDTIIVLFGSTGDLTYRMLMPSLTNLYNNKSLNETFKVIAVGRRDYDNEAYFNYMLEHNSKLDIETIEKFTTYYKMQITDKNDYQGLKTYIDSFSNENTKVISYMAVAPYFFLDVAKNIEYAKIIEKDNNNHTVIFEKPFGNDLTSAQKLNKELWKLFDESQIYRIDHYLAKIMIQNILKLRFENQIIKDLWNDKHIESIHLIAKEAVGIVGRGAFYDVAGALKDMVQSHLLQVASLLVMDKPKAFNASSISDEKLRALNSFGFSNENIVLGQYKGYLDEEEVSKDSITETASYIKLASKTSCLKDIPVTLITGKKFNEKSSKIIVKFKEELIKYNKLIITFDPINEIVLKGYNELDSTIISKENIESDLEGYDKMLYDAIKHDKSLFIRWDEVETSWSLTDKIKDKSSKPIIYNNYSDFIDKVS